MKTFSHPLIVKIIDDFIDSKNHQCIIQEFYSQGDFNRFLIERKNKLFKEDEVILLLSNIIMAVYHLNSRGIYHRDVKPENFLIKSDSTGNILLHLCDFGLAKNTKAEYERLSSGNEV